MNPLTLVKRIQKINSREAALGVSEEASWHAKYKDSAYVYVGGVPFDLTEGDLLAVFSQYGEVVDVNLIRDKGTGKSKGFAFVAYEDQRSTTLAVGRLCLLLDILYLLTSCCSFFKGWSSHCYHSWSDNLNGAQLLGRIIRVDHVSNYKKKEEEDEEEMQRKREERGVCRAFQRGECTRGASCKFSHNEQRAANTGWGAEDKEQRWGHDKYDGPQRGERKSGHRSLGRSHEPAMRDGRMFNDTDNSTARDKELRGELKEQKRSRRHDDDFEPESRRGSDWREDTKSRRLDKIDEFKSLKDRDHREENRMNKSEDDAYQPKKRESRDWRGEDEYMSRRRDDYDRREGKSWKKQESDLYTREDGDTRGGEKRSTHDRDKHIHKRDR